MMPIAAENDHIKIAQYSLGPYGTNTYLIFCKKTNESAVVDAPGDPDTVLAALEGSSCKYILMTHNHMDHTGALAQLKTALKVPVAAHPDDASGLPLTPDILLADKDSIKVGDLELTVIHTPGHTPGSVCFLNGLFLISGDTLFPGGPGKTWSAEAFGQIIASLTEKIFTLPGDTRVFPGHGDPAQVSKEKDKYHAFAAKGIDPGLYGDVSWG